MPSGHAALAACGTVLLLPVAPRPVGALLVGVTAVSAWIRVHQGAHQPVDVVAGVLLGGAVGLAASDLGRSCT
jgi:undecaprenyl-diphosphatase